MTTETELPDYRNLFDLTGKVVVVTGAVGILGRHFCSAYAAYGAQVVVVDLDQVACDRLATTLGARFGNPCLGVACDVARPDSVAAMVDRTVAALGRIDVLHNNAVTKGSSLEKLFAPVETYDLAYWRELSAVNIDGVFLVAQAVGAQMVRQGSGGSMIQTSSIYGIVGPDQRIYEGSEYLGRPINSPAAYSASKAAVNGLTRYFATYWAPHRIRVNSLIPGGVESGQNQTFQQRYGNRVPLGRMAEAREIVGAAVWLASDAATYVTGQEIIVDGGLTAW